MNTQIEQPVVAALSSEKLAEIELAVAKALKPLICGKTVNTKAVNVSWYETEEHCDGDTTVTASVVLGSDIDAVSGFTPTYASSIFHVDFHGCRVNKETNALEWANEDLDYTLNYGFYSYNTTWGYKKDDGSMEYNNGEVFGIESAADDELSCGIIERSLDFPDTDKDYQEFLKAISIIACKGECE